MYGRVRCICGRWMRSRSFEPATACSGGRAEYRCLCGAVASIWSRHGIDDEPCAGVLMTGDGEYRLVHAWSCGEWRVEGGAT